ncbi:MAG: NADH-quinone oxidoreductase subunit M [Planctomycetes bacterium]|nr:NADH-quinone oxidoreductase subunit M [Planctomycetota bacterium]
MTLLLLIAIPLCGGFLAWLLGRFHADAPRWISLAALGVGFILALDLGLEHWGAAGLANDNLWLLEYSHAWIPRFGISFHLALDGLNLLMVVLTFLIGILAVGCSWKEISTRVGFFHFNLMWVLAGVVGVFLAIDLFLFYFFWELMLVPMYFLIGIWGHEKRIRAALKFFIFTQASGLLLLLAIVALAFSHQSTSGVLSYNYMELLGTPLSEAAGMWMMLGFFIAFAVKLPVVPLHTWLPDAHTEAPTAGSVILAALMLKTGAYGLIRFVVPLFPDAAMAFAPIAMTLGVIGILYGAILAFAQTDLKRLVAYTSVSHLGFVLLGVFAWNELALQGVVMQMICHSFSTGALFVLVGALYERTHTRDLSRLSGLWAVAPKMGAMAMFFAMASLGLPGLGNFLAEILVLAGAYPVSIPLTALATVGLIFATIYSVRLVSRAFHGVNEGSWEFSDLSLREAAVLGVMVVGLIWLGLYPQPVLDAAAPTLSHLLSVMQR